MANQAAPGGDVASQGVMVCLHQCRGRRGLDILAAAGIIAWAFARMGVLPRPAYIALIGAGALVLYSLWE
jgi:hypothetical protein